MNTCEPPIQEAVDAAADFVAARREFALSDETMSILLHLSKSGGDCQTRRQIADSCKINITSLPRYLTRLVKSGHVEKLGVDTDGRERVFRISAHGLRLVGRLVQSFAHGRAS